MSSYRLPDGTVPVLLSSDTPDGLRREAAAIREYALDRPRIAPARIAAMLFRTRSARRHRALIMASGRDDLLAGLGAVAAGESHPAVVASAEPARPRRVAYVFPGQGSQRPGMGRMLYDHSSAYRAAVEECDDMFGELFGLSPLKYLLDADMPPDDSAETVQPALFLQMIGVAAMWRAAGVEPVATVGHSQGEIAAAYLSGAQTLHDAVLVVTNRARIVDGLQLDGYSMAVLGVGREECEDLLARHAGWAELSVVNSPSLLAISGESATVRDIVELLNGEGKFAREIRVQYPAHTSFLQSVREPLAGTVDDAMDNREFFDTEIDCIGATFGDRIQSDLSITDYWYLNLRNRVRFDRAVATAIGRGVDTFLEISEHPTLMLAMQENLAAAGGKQLRALATSRRTAEDLAEFTRNLASVAVHDADFHWDALREKVCEPPELPLLDFPNTQMAAKKLWAAYPYETSAGEAASAPAVGVPTRRVVERWQRLSRRTMTPPRTFAVVDHTGRCGDLVAALPAAARRLGATPAEKDADTVVILLPESGGATAADAVDGVAAFLGDRGWLPDLDGVREVWLVTVGGERVLPADVPDVAHAAAQSGFRCLAPEHLGVAFRHLDLAAAETGAAAAKSIVGAIHTAGEPELAARDGGLYVKRLHLDDDAASGRPLRDAELRDVLIIGGTGKLGLELCGHLARAGAGRITLLSRSGGDAAAAERISALRDSGAEIVVRRCDITDEDAVRALAEEYRGGGATLVVHAAVDYAATGETPTPASVYAAAAPKILGLDLVLRHLPLAPDGRVVLCSTLVATLGGRDNMVYAATNRMLDALAVRYRERGIACSSVQWGLWPEVGAGREQALARTDGTGVHPVDPAAAVAAGLTTAAADCIVAAVDWATLRRLFEMFGQSVLFDALPADEPAATPEPEPVPVASEAPVAPPDTAAPAVQDTGERVRQVLRVVMGLEPDDVIDGSVPLVALGLDSLQALDLRRRVETELQRELPVTAILGGGSLDEVVALLG
ncbi:nocobactin polyketide synthase NbtC [Nocardia wallacei]|uniref:nocobactin polyketide synthase NbtC n=1 Tax=Nocardia wallacei TaxID=480035 RepID=UPI002455686F|nr:nocobactin polyketide synthase NbtC [Nocardia wallacei]